MADSPAQVRDPLTALLRRDRWIVLGGLGALTLFTAVESRWVGDAMMDTSSSFLVFPLARWGPAELATIALMWGVMMIAMMTPTASPMVLSFAGLERRRAGAAEAPGGKRAFSLADTWLSGWASACWRPSSSGLFIPRRCCPLAE
jgi:hypothetical protein